MLRHAQGKARRGFSIIEILIAIVVLSIGIFGVLGALTYGLRAGEFTSRTTKATNMARKLLEAMLTLPLVSPGAPYTNEPAFDPTDPLTHTQVDAPPFTNQLNDISAGERGSYFRQITYETNTGGLNWEAGRLAIIRVRVIYYDKNSRAPKTAMVWGYDR